MKKFIYLLFAAIAVISSSCEQKEREKQDNSPELSTVKKSSLNADEFEKKINEGSGIQLIDVRTPEEFADGHIASAVNYNIDSPDFEAQINSLEKTRPVLLYCRTSRRSGMATELLQDKGFSEVYYLEGGILEWTAAGKPIESTTKTNLSEKDFMRMVTADKLVLVDFSAEWCGPCRFISPMLAQIAEEKKDKLTVLKIDVDNNQNLAQQKQINSIPYLELYKNGKLIWSHTGIISREELIKETGL